MPTASPYDFVGCYTEGSGGRALNAKQTASGTAMTIQACAAFCSGFKYFATEYAAECYCGNTLGAGSAAADLADCSMPCSGNAFQYCGGPNRIELYQTDPATPPSGPVQPATVAGGLWSFYQCATETAGVRALAADGFAADTMTLEACALYCDAYAYFGTEYGRECYCGAGLNAGSVEAPASDCSMACAANANNFCGNGNRLSVYSKTA